MKELGLVSKIIPPTVEEVRIYFNQKGINNAEADDFFLFYEFKNWTSRNGNYYKSWKNIAFQWIATIIRNQPDLYDRRIH